MIVSKIHRLLIIILFSLAAIPIPSLGAEAQEFCAIGEDIQPRHGQDMWGAETVQHYIRDLLQKPHLVDTPAAAYAISYLVMTKERDKERCGGMLSADDIQSERIGDLLADVMSRWLVLATDQCLHSPSRFPASVGICGAVQRVATRKDDTLRSALELTSVYLSSHMASALAAVILFDTLWNDAFPPETHCLPNQQCPASATAARIKYVKRYKSLFDKNNAFLARHIDTVIKSLTRACYIRKGLVTRGAVLVNDLPINVLVFGQLRDQTFAAAIDLASSIRRQNHPMLARAEDGTWRIEYQKVTNYSVTPTTLLELESTARKTFSSNALAWILKPLGGQTPDDLAAIRPSVNPACEYPKSDD